MSHGLDCPYWHTMARNILLQKSRSDQTDLTALAGDIKRWGTALGFQQIGITDTDLEAHEIHLLNWLQADYNGEMAYMARHGVKRSPTRTAAARYGASDFGTHGLLASPWL